MNFDQQPHPQEHFSIKNILEHERDALSRVNSSHDLEEYLMGSQIIIERSVLPKLRNYRAGSNRRSSQVSFAEKFRLFFNGFYHVRNDENIFTIYKFFESYNRKLFALSKIQHPGDFKAELDKFLVEFDDIIERINNILSVQ